MPLTPSAFAQSLSAAIDRRVSGVTDFTTFQLEVKALYQGNNLTIEDLALGVSQLVETVEGWLAREGWGYGLWATLQARDLAGVADGQVAKVFEDPGEHEDPVTGETVPNQGVFSLRLTEPSGWTYLAPLEADDAKAYRDAAADHAAAAGAAKTDVLAVVDLSRSVNFSWVLRDALDRVFLGLLEDDLMLPHVGASSRLATWEENSRLGAEQRHGLPFPVDAYTHLGLEGGGQSEVTAAAAPNLGLGARRADCKAFGASPNPVSFESQIVTAYAPVASADLYPLQSPGPAEHPMVMAAWTLAGAMNDRPGGAGKTLVVGTTGVPGTSLEERAKGADPELYARKPDLYAQLNTLVGAGNIGLLAVLNWDGPSNYMLDGGVRDYATVLELYDRYWLDTITDAKATFKKGGVPGTAQDWDPAWFQVLTAGAWSIPGDQLSVNRAQLDWVLAKRRQGKAVWAVGPTSHMPKRADQGPHPMATSAMWAGALFGKHMADVINGGLDRHSPYIEWTKISGRYIHLGVRSPLPIGFEDYYFISDVHNAPDKGLGVTDQYGPLLSGTNPKVVQVIQVASNVLRIECEVDPDPATYRVWAGTYDTERGYFGGTNIFDTDGRLGSAPIPALDPAYLETEKNPTYPEQNIPALVGKLPHLRNPLAPYVTGGDTGGDWNMTDHITALLADTSWQAA